MEENSMLTRIRDLVSANLNSMLDRAEDPEKMVNEYIRQLTENLNEAKISVAGSMADETKLHTKMVEFQAQTDQWQSKAAAALRANDEDLAKQALARKLQAQKMADSYRQQYEEQDAQVEELQDALVKLESRISEARSKRELIVAKQNRAQTQEAIQRTVAGLGNITAMDRLGQLEERVDDRLARANALDQLNHGTLEARFESLEQDQDLDAELSNLKQLMGHGSPQLPSTEHPQLPDSGAQDASRQTQG
jgi:phage shock protein A